MIRLHPGTTTADVIVPIARRRIRWLPLAAMLCALALSAIAAGPARADPIAFQHVLINGQPANLCTPYPDRYCGSSPYGLVFVTITAKSLPSQGNQSRAELRLETDSNRFGISEVLVQLSGPYVTFQQPGPGTGTACFDFSVSTASLDCSLDGGPSSQQLIDIVSQGPQPALRNLDVNIGGKDALNTCEFPAGPALDARIADACTPPSDTKITRAKIGRNTAFFGFTGRLAKHFQCVLSRNRRIMFNHQCQSPKPYANALPSGKYTFRVFGVNAAGFDPTGAVKNFTVA